MRKKLFNKLEDRIGVDIDGDGLIGGKRPSGYQGGQQHHQSGQQQFQQQGFQQQQQGFAPPGYQQQQGFAPQGHNPHQGLFQQIQAFGSGFSGGGRKKALLIGINYTGQQGQLRGCVNDVGLMKNFLKQHGFSESNMKILVDDPSWRTEQPTKNNLFQGFQWLTGGARSGDSLFLHYSGHGGRVRDTSGDEADGWDETIVPVDFKKYPGQSGQITDDELFERIVRPLPAGCKLTAVMDCCHSGTVLDLPYIFTADDQHMKSVFVNGKFQPNALPQMVFNYKWDLKDKKRLKMQALQFGMDLAGQFFGKPPENAGGGGGGGQGGFQQSGQQTHIQADVIMFSGCDDHQTSADVGNASSFGHNLPSGSGPGGAGGACTNALVAACSKKPNIMYIELLDDMRHILRQKRFTQVPQLSASKPVDLGAQFIL
jgi:hypothetical protein